MHRGFFKCATWSTSWFSATGHLWFLIVCVLFMMNTNTYAEGPETGKVTRTRGEVEALIKQVGKASPDWWESTALNYPDTLDLNWPLRATGGWNNRVNMGQYLWDIVNPNPGRWQEGIRLVHFLMIKHKDDRAKLARSMQTLGSMFHNFTQD